MYLELNVPAAIALCATIESPAKKLSSLYLKSLGPDRLAGNLANFFFLEQ